jgi:hypothetical protein
LERDPETAKQSEMKRKFYLFVSQTEAKIMQNGRAGHKSANFSALNLVR